MQKLYETSYRQFHHFNPFIPSRGEYNSGPLNIGFRNTAYLGKKSKAPIQNIWGKKLMDMDLIWYI